LTLVACIGGGQLGRMLGLAGIPLGLELRFLDPSPDAPARAVGELVVGAYDDPLSLRRLAHGADVVTYEFENVPAAAARAIGAVPDARALAPTQDRLEEKELFRRLGIPTPEFRSPALPALAKTRRLGYDGKGQAVLRSATDLEPAWQRLGDQPLILESFVPFEREVAMLVARGRKGQVAFYPVVETTHRDGILRTARPRAKDPLQDQAQAYVRSVVDRLDYVGVLAFEFFVHSGSLLGNEIAPRVHNSGHWTIEGSHCSQFENHLRAIAGLPLGDPSLRAPCAMVNFIGSAPALGTLASLPGVHAHLYGKAAKPQRKIGHATLLAESDGQLGERLAALTALVERRVPQM